MKQEKVFQHTGWYVDIICYILQAVLVVLHSLDRARRRPTEIQYCYTGELSVIPEHFSNQQCLAYCFCSEPAIPVQSPGGPYRVTYHFFTVKQSVIGFSWRSVDLFPNMEMCSGSQSREQRKLRRKKKGFIQPQRGFLPGHFFAFTLKRRPVLCKGKKKVCVCQCCYLKIYKTVLISFFIYILLGYM